MDLPDGYAFRSPTRDDIDAVGDLLGAAAAEQGGEATLDADFVRGDWAHPHFEPANDAWVASDGSGTVVGYGHVVLEQPDVVESWGVVHPEHRDRGIGSELLDRIERRASELLAGVPSARFRHAIDADDAAAEAILRARGLRPVRHFWHMQIDLDGPVEPGPAPEGIEITGVGDGDLRTVHSVLDDAFAEDWGYHPASFDRWLEEYTTGPRHDPSLWLLATADGQPVGALTASVMGERGWVGEVGVRRGHRGRGIGAALLRRSFAAFAGRGFDSVLLNVDAENPTGATALYERAGMRIAHRWILLERSHVTSR